MHEMHVKFIMSRTTREGEILWWHGYVCENICACVYIKNAAKQIQSKKTGMDSHLRCKR